MRQGENEREPATSDPDALAKLLELELMQKRAVWQRAAASRSSFRTLSFIFLFLIVMAALLGLFYVFSIMDRPKGERAQSPSAPITAPP